MGNADAILIADLHLSETTPISRVDDYIKAQAKKLNFLKNLSLENRGCPILCAGDIFDKWKISPWFCSWVYQHLPYMITIPGNHDLPMHSFEQYDKSALSLLEIVGAISVLAGTGVSPGQLEVVGVPFGMLKGFTSDSSFLKTRSLESKRKVLLLHELVWPGKSRPAWAEGSYSAGEILDRFNGYFDLIVTGDNHEYFTYQQQGSLLVNPGSMMRMTASQADLMPKCYLYYAKYNTVTPVSYPIDEGVHNREHLDRIAERDERVTAYIERMNKDWEIGLSFRKNLEVFFAKNNTPRKVRDIIWLSLEKTS